MPSAIVRQLITKTYQELNHPPKPIQRSRVWQSTNGYIFLIPWANASLLRILVHRFTDSLSKTHYRFKIQIDDAARSTIANIEEGYARPTTAEYLTFLGFSQGSLKEVKGDIQRALQDGLLRSVGGSSLTNLGISLKDWHEKLKASVISRPAENTRTKGDYRKLEEIRGKEVKGKDIKERNTRNSFLQYPLNSFKFLYPPIDDLERKCLTYEIFIELINKTDWHLRRLVTSLENKLQREQKYYQIEKARIRSNLHMS